MSIFFSDHKYEQKYGHYCLKKSSFLTHIIVSQGDWLWKPANIKVENNSSVVYVQSFLLTVHNSMAQWWEHSHSTNVAYVQFQALKSRVGWVCCSFSPFLRKVFPWVIRFSPLLNNQLFQIPFRFGRHEPFSTSSLDLLSAPWVNKLHALFSWQIMTKEINAMFPLVTNFKMIRMLLNVGHTGHVQKSKQKVI